MKRRKDEEKWEKEGGMKAELKEVQRSQKKGIQRKQNRKTEKRKYREGRKKKVQRSQNKKSQRGGWVGETIYFLKEQQHLLRMEANSAKVIIHIFCHFEL